MDVPATAGIALTAIGIQCGMRLADGRLVRPWLIWEIEDANGDHRDMTTDELSMLGLMLGIDITVLIEAN